MRGLWSQHFPSSAKSPPSPPRSHSQSPPAAKTPAPWSQSPTSPLPLPPSPPDGYERCLICPTCNAACCLLKSFTKSNPNRLFYTCPEHDHKFFKWADSVNPSEFIDVPYCGGCKAGVCRVRKEKTGPNAGRILFMCRIKEGEGSCGYRVWQDEHDLSVSEAGPNSCESSSTIVDLAEESPQNDEATNNVDVAYQHQGIGATTKRMDNFEYDIVDLVEERTQDEAADESASGKIEKFKWQEGKAHESSRRPPKRSRHGNIISARSGTPSKNLVLIQRCWMRAAIRKNLSTELQGWWGRLAFHPMPNLIIHASCYIASEAIGSSSSDNIFENLDPSTTITRKLLEVQTLTTPQVCSAGVTETNPSQVALDIPSSSNNFHKTKLSIVMGDSISKAFVQAAMDLQNKFITLLETTDVQDHESMTREAEVTFAALDCLMFDHHDLKEHTKEFINRAMTLSEIRQSMPENDSHQRLLDHCSDERTKLDEIRRIHAETRQTLTSKQNHLKTFREQVSSTKNWLAQIETELSSREGEIKKMECVWNRISEDKVILEEKYDIAAKQLEEYRRLHLQHDAAEAAFDSARALLREHIFSN